MAAKARRRISAFRFSPFSVKQLMLLTWWTSASPYRDWDGIIAEGSIRAGKTIGMIDSFVMWGQTSFSAAQNFIIAGRSMGTLRRNVLEPLFQILKAKGIRYHYHRSENWVRIGRHTYYLFGAANESSQDVLQGLTAAGAYIDEVALIPRSFVDQAMGRCSVEGSKYFFNCNPGGPKHWFKVDFIDQAGAKRLLVLHFTMDDNPSLSEAVKERYKRMYSGVWFKRMILGLWVIAEGLVYDMWDEALHVRSTLQLPPKGKYERYVAAADYGTSGVCVFGLYGVYQSKGPDGKPAASMHKVKERYYDARESGRQKTDSEHARDFKAFLGPIVPAAIYVDPSAASFIAELKRSFQKVRPAVNDVEDGIRFVSRMLSEGRYHIDPSCKQTIREKGTYSWDPKAQERGEDKPLKRDDHCSDEERYALYSHLGRPSAEVQVTRI